MNYIEFNERSGELLKELRRGKLTQAQYDKKFDQLLLQVINRKIKTLEDLKELANQTDANTVNEMIFHAIREGHLPASVFLEYQGITQGDVRDCLNNEESERG